MLGLAKTYSSTVLELPVEPDTNLRNLFSQLSIQYPAFEALLDPKPSGALWGIIVTVNGELVPISEYHQTVLRDSTEVSLFPPYLGG